MNENGKPLESWIWRFTILAAAPSTCSSNASLQHFLPEKLFYNTTAPGIIVFLNKAKSQKQKGKLLLLNASGEFANTGEEYRPIGKILEELNVIDAEAVVTTPKLNW